MDIHQSFEHYAIIMSNGFTPDIMIVADPRMLPEGTEPGTYMLTKGQEPVRLGSTEQFDELMVKMLHREPISCSATVGKTADEDESI
jgi:hypothetical protein